MMTTRPSEMIATVVAVIEVHLLTVEWIRGNCLPHELLGAI